MNVKQLITDDDAVSPVIGVILMVAITVILAAVIATFVLGLGEQVSESSPQASFSFEWEGSSGSPGELTITHDGGATIAGQNIYLRGDKGGSGGDISGTWIDNGGTVGSANSEVKAGMSVTLSNVAADGNVKVVWQSDSGDSSATLADWQGPSA